MDITVGSSLWIMTDNPHFIAFVLLSKKVYVRLIWLHPMVSQACHPTESQEPAALRIERTSSWRQDLVSTSRDSHIVKCAQVDVGQTTRPWCFHRMWWQCLLVVLECPRELAAYHMLSTTLIGNWRGSWEPCPKKSLQYNKLPTH